MLIGRQLKRMRQDRTCLSGFLLKVLGGRQYQKLRFENKFGIFFQPPYSETTKHLMKAGLRSLEALGMEKIGRTEYVVQTPMPLLWA